MAEFGKGKLIGVTVGVAILVFVATMLLVDVFEKKQESRKFLPNMIV